MPDTNIRLRAGQSGRQIDAYRGDLPRFYADVEPGETVAVPEDVADGLLAQVDVWEPAGKAAKTGANDAQ